MNDAPAIVVADDDWATRMLVAINLEPDGYEVRSASSAREIEEALADGEASLVLLDIRMGGDNGIEIGIAVSIRGEFRALRKLLQQRLVS